MYKNLNLKKISALLDEHKIALVREIQETRELKDLLLKGLRHPLSKAERKQMREQLVDICLRVPALSLLIAAPGGGLVLLMLYRVLPVWLLPSAYRTTPLPAGAAAEVFVVVDEEDRVMGSALRSECHGNPLLIHRVAHVLVFNSRGELLLQKRSPHKDIQPDKWDTSVGGHLQTGEDYERGAYRELEEELGISGTPLTFLYRYPLRNAVESENVATYLCVYDGEIAFAAQEISEVRHWSTQEIENCLGRDLFTPNFEEEFAYYKQWRAARRSSASPPGQDRVPGNIP